MSKKKLIKVGIIGGGFGYYGHYKAFQKISSCKVVAIVTKKKLNLPKSIKIYNSVKKLITNELYTKADSDIDGNSCKIKKINNRKRTIARAHPKIILATPLIFGI